MAEAIALELSLSESEIKELKIAAHLHDIGKLTLPSVIVNKPGKLNAPERFMVRQHAHIGWEMLKGFDLGHIVEDVILHHHERFDGLGYPHRLKGNDVSIYSCIVRIADMFQALTNDRPYRPLPYTKAEAIKIINTEKDSFRPEVLEAFCAVAKCYDFIP